MARTLINAATVAALLPALWLAGESSAQEGTARLTVAVDGLQQDSPQVYISVYKDKESWLGDDAAAYASIDPASGDFAAGIALPPGRYAFTAYLDVNGNEKLDRNFIGIPKEPVALSNDARARMGPPKFDDAVFDLPEQGVTQTVELKVP